jgi:hypothetical protein
MTKHKGHRKKKGGKRKGKKKSKMPANVLAYFKYRNAGMSKASAKKKAGL